LERKPVSLDQIIQAAIAVVSAILGFIMRELWTAVQKLRADLSELQSTIPTLYVQKEDYKSDINRVHDFLDKIYDKLDRKIDK